MLDNGSQLNDLIDDLRYICFLSSFGSVGHAVSEKKLFQKSTNQKQELPVAAMFVNRQGRIEQSLQRSFHRCFLPSSVHLVIRFQRRICFRNQPIKKKNCLWRPCLLTDWDEIRNLNRGHSIDASYQNRFSWPCAFRGKYLLEINQSERRIACGSHVC